MPSFTRLESSLAKAGTLAARYYYDTLAPWGNHPLISARLKSHIVLFLLGLAWLGLAWAPCDSVLSSKSIPPF